MTNSFLKKARSKYPQFLSLAVIVPVYFFIIGALIFFSPARPAFSADYSVTNTNDSGPGSLRAAITGAITNGNPALITFNLAYPAKINLESALPTITTGISIQGPAGEVLSISGQNLYRQFNISGVNGAAGNLTLENLTLEAGAGTYQGGAIYNDGGSLTLSNTKMISNKVVGIEDGLRTTAWGGVIYSKNGVINITNSDFSYNQAQGAFLFGDSYAGVIYAQFGSLSIEGSTFSNNKAQSSPFITNNFAGAIFCDSCNSFTLNNSLVENNTAGNDRSSWAAGGGLFLQNVSGAIISNSTISHNKTAGSLSQGGGVRLFATSLTVFNSTIANNEVSGPSGSSGYGGGIGYPDLNSSLTLINSTVAYNKLYSDGGSTDFYGGGIFSYTGPLTIANSIIAGNSVPTEAKGNDLYGSAVTSGGFNILGNAVGTSAVPATGDQFNVNPQLGILENNGGPAPTIELLPQSPAIDAGGSSFCNDPATVNGKDQRGFSRNAGTGCDIGAYEFPPTLTVTDLSDSNEPPTGSLRQKLTEAAGYDQARIVFDPSFESNSQVNLVSPLAVPANTRVEAGCANRVQLNGAFNPLLSLGLNSRLQGLILQSTTGPILSLTSDNHRLSCSTLKIVENS